MALKSARLGRAENLDSSTRDRFNLPDKGLIIIETMDPDLHENIKLIDKDGIRGYLLTLGSFTNTEIPEDS